MDPWPKRIDAITLFVEDLGAAKAFYRDVFGLPIHFENADSAVFKFGESVINLLRIDQRGRAHLPGRGGATGRWFADGLHDRRR